ncbi:protein kintoun [Brachyhypopomus gauderio]|uniref:protein kintoun n=1 Tax=Brachyhypopomus gauderio TaxID=698409 RepID=UPI0040429F06
MDFGNKLEELQLSTDEINRFSKALKDEKFRELLHEYAEEISNPENRKRYEEEITQLELERGNNVQFIHPKPHHVLKTVIGGKEKCFINVCSNELINKPMCEVGRSEDDRVGQQWSLPYSLSPGRPDRDVKGNKCMIYDVVFHPDTLYIAVKNPRFMKLVNSTATQGIEDAFKVKLDSINVKVLKTQYKGVPHPAVIRKPLPGHPGVEKSAPDLPLSSLYPDKSDILSSKNPVPPPITPTQGGPRPVKHSSSLPTQPTKPNYIIKYRSVVDLQDYRCSRDSAPSPRPKEIVVTIDLPLLKSAGDAELDISERKLVLESQKPAYKLELQLSYPVDGDRGEAKFNKAKKQLIITLPVLPAKNPVVGYTGANQLVSGDEDKKDEKECDEGEVEVNEATELALVKDEESKIKPPVCNCDAKCLRDRPVQNEKTRLQLSPDICEINHLELNCVPSESHTVADTPLTFKANKKIPKLKQNTTNEEEDFCTSEIHYKNHSKEETNNGSSTEKFHSDTESTGFLESVFECDTHTKYCLVAQDKITGNSQFEFAGGQNQISQGVLQLEKALNNIPNVPTNSSQQLISKSVVFSVEPSKMISAPEDDTKSTVSFPEDTGMLYEEHAMNSSPEHLSPTAEHKNNVNASLIEEIEVPLNYQVSNLYFSEQNQVNINIKTTTILKETNPEDGSEVIISDHATSSGLSFQNSLWFDLD